jgi:putative DNA primase/helicase
MHDDLRGGTGDADTRTLSLFGGAAGDESQDAPAPDAGVADVVFTEADRGDDGELKDAHEGEGLPSDAGNPAPAPEPESDEAAIKRLSEMSPFDYDRARKGEAKRMGVTVPTLDEAVKDAKAARNINESSPFDDPAPWGEEVDGDAVAHEVAHLIRRHIICDDETVTATVLWCMVSWTLEVAKVCPILLISAPEKACGKTQLLTVVGYLVPRPAQAAGISSSVLFRMIDMYRPTVLVDEIETVLKGDEELRGLLNAGHTKQSAFVWRSEPDGDGGFVPTKFSVFGFKAFAGIGADRLAETVTSRSVIVQMRRKMPHETAERLRHADPLAFEVLRSKLARWAQDNMSAIRAARPHLPDELDDRQQDNWEPLLAIADLIGGDWPALAMRAALKLCAPTDAGKSAGVELLTDIEDAFDSHGSTNKNGVRGIFQSVLLDALCEDEEKPWATLNRGKPMTANQLRERLKPYGIHSKQVRIGYEGKKGFELDQFKDAFRRYVHGGEAEKVETENQPNAGGASGVSGAAEENYSVEV